MDSQHKLKWTLYVSIATLFIIISLVQVGPFSSVKMTMLPTPLQDSHKNVIVFDGGSTGTRIHVFTFSHNPGGILILKHEYFQEVKPGLSSFADNPRKAADSIGTLLKQAKSFIPASSWHETPVVLKATAGLRLLPSHLSDAILNVISNTLKKSSFLLNAKSVSILDEKDEGLYAWYTINFLLGKLKEPASSVASLDLGGGSTQVTFAPVDLDTFVLSPKDHIVQAKVQNRTMTLYTHSYLGLGLMSARYSILQLSFEEQLHIDFILLSSPCIHPKVKTSWKHSRKEYIVSGSKEGEYGFYECYEKVLAFLQNSVHQPAELWKREIYGLSYYFDRAVDLGIIGENGGQITVGDYMEASKKVCSQNIPEKPFLCLDSCYITAYLHHSLGFDKQKKIMLVKQLDGIETSWALGAAFNLLQ